ncbi:hypothetical protein SASPL_143414 [Salvia splendens]|uniref:F-box/LRR-repeat protein 15-like leucin rich repeat domain-containing protein n=1 Tax=Salvia splendens TaxID=180675 RepID=A0A8X8WNA9_SALSN|nr:F-box protein At3g58530-like [Salvia splendens]XP_042022358.1 F-box protein At3g58530-like [Salvia splendens]XP_042022359.1 F-box protein At3g58530-like [Salvia splendens]KAG6397248.1 hypothetical protein SASPL_143414 [Salvia splendens]
MEVEKEESVELWCRETLPKVMKIVSVRLPQRDLINLLLVSPWINRNLVSHPSLWLVLDFHEMSDAGNRLVAALSLPRYQNVKHINLEFARDIEDKHLENLKNKCGNSVKNVETLNLNGCQKISDIGIGFITSNCSKLKVFSIYWNVRVSDLGIRSLVNNCKLVIDLNLSGCKNVTDESLKLIAENYQGLQLLNITRCVKITDKGLDMVLVKCSSLHSLNLYALSSFTDAAYKRISLLTHLRFLDLCGAQNLSDDGLSCIAKCKNLTSLNLTWCVRITDQGVVSLAEGCKSLEFLSLFGIVGVTDKSLEALSGCCSATLTTLDVNGCIGIKRRSRDELLQLFPKLVCFKVHS